MDLAAVISKLVTVLKAMFVGAWVVAAIAFTVIILALIGVIVLGILGGWIV